MRKICFSLAFIATTIIAVAQSSYPCVVKTDNQWKLSNYSSELGEFEAPTISLGSEYSRNTFIKYAGQNQYAYSSFDGTSSTIHVRNDAGGHFKSTRLYDHVLSLSFVESKNKLVYLATSKVPNYYDFLTEDVSITILDLVDNTSLKVKIPTFSIFVPTLPYVGQQTKKDARGLTQTHNFSISLPTVNTDKSEFLFVARDIPGFNRLVKLDLNTNKVRTVSVQIEALSLAYCATTKTVKGLTVEENADGSSSYYVVDINDMTGEVSNKVLLEVQNKALATEQNGSIQYDAELDQLFVTKTVNGATMAYQIDAESNEVVESSAVTENADIFIPQQTSKDHSRLFTLSNVVKVYPNPTQDVISVETDLDMLVDAIVLTDATGKVLRNISVQSGMTTNQINIANVSQGIYYLKVTSGTETHVEKIVKY